MRKRTFFGSLILAFVLMLLFLIAAASDTNRRYSKTILLSGDQCQIVGDNLVCHNPTTNADHTIAFSNAHCEIVGNNLVCQTFTPTPQGG